MESIIDHVSVNVTEFARAEEAFHVAAIHGQP
jgi:chemotaxis methyl-accepting protein methylase